MESKTIQIAHIGQFSLELIHTNTHLLTPQPPSQTYTHYCIICIRLNQHSRLHGVMFSETLRKLQT